MRPCVGVACGNRPPRMAFPALPSVPDIVNPDAWLTHVNEQQVVRRVNRQGFVKVDLHPYSISSFDNLDMSSQIHRDKMAWSSGRVHLPLRRGR
jgi:hypothetical protein